MSACCCSLAGTAACQTCSQNPFAVMSKMMTPQPTILRDIMVNAQTEKPMTNGDKIRSMSDYDLADWIADILNHCDNKKPEDECLDSCPLYTCCNDGPDSIEDWLKLPAEEEDG